MTAYHKALAKLIRKEMGLSWTPIIVSESFEGRQEVQIGDYTWDYIGGALEITFKSPVNDELKFWSRSMLEANDFANLMEELLSL